MVPIVALIGVNISSLVSNITQTLHAIDLKQEIEFSLDVAKVSLFFTLKIIPYAR